ncbi:sodA, partial [Symbiodinium pilosum]
MVRRFRGALALAAATLVCHCCTDLRFVTPKAEASEATRRGLATSLAMGLASLVGLESAHAYDLPDLPYAYDALEPSIDKATMEFHHDKHHLTYVTNINKALEGKTQPALVELQKSAIKDGAAFRNSGGGAYNHNFFWLEMAPTGTGGAPSEKLAAAIDEAFGSMDDFKAKFEAAGAPGARFGSGWVWLVVADDKKLAITSTPNQDNPLMEGVEGTAGIPILGCDVWEHAYYLKYQYRRPDYIKAWWDVVNWNQVSAWYEDALGGKAPTADSATSTAALIGKKTSSFDLKLGFEANARYGSISRTGSCFESSRVLILSTTVDALPASECITDIMGLAEVSGRPAKPKTPTPPVERQPVAVRDIEVVVRHAVPEGPLANEVLLTVKSNATIKSVKEALVAHLGKPELLRSCRLVQPVGENGAFSSFKDNEKLNGRRALLVLGIPSLRPAGEEPPEEPAAEKASSTAASPDMPAARKPEAKAVAPEPPKLSISQALALQLLGLRDLLQGFADPAFQEKRKDGSIVTEAEKQHSDPRRFSAERQKLFLTGVFDMLQQFDRPEITSNGEFQQQGAVLNHLLFAEEMAEPTQAEAAAQVVVRHAVQEGPEANEEVLLTVKSNATIKSVREAGAI